MKKTPLLRYGYIGLGLALIVFGIHHIITPIYESDKNKKPPITEEKKSEKAEFEYILRLLRDPVTGRIPIYSQQKELEHHKKLTKTSSTKSGASINLTWKELGPNNVGGRTRAFAIDQRNNKILLAGGADGGMWRSTDGGESWTLTTNQLQNGAITSVAQDPKQPDIWYFITGEFKATSFGDNGSKERYYGATGIFKSMNNGMSWTFLPYKPNMPHSNEQNQFTDNYLQPFNLTYKVLVCHMTSNIYVVTHYEGIFKSTDEGEAFTRILKHTDISIYNDLVIDSSGNLIAYIGGYRLGFPTDTILETKQEKYAGIYRSDDYGETWGTNLMPKKAVPDLLANSLLNRAVLALVPQNQQELYVFIEIGGQDIKITDSANIMEEDTRLFKMNLEDNTLWKDYTRQINPVINHTYQNFAMALTIDPKDSTRIFIGAVDLFRFSTNTIEPLDTFDKYHIGGSGYTNHHADQHLIIFDPVDTNVVWSINDGGVYRTKNSKADTVIWEDKNKHYNITQFYTVAVDFNEVNTNIIADSITLFGGTQDNGTPLIKPTIPVSSLLNSQNETYGSEMDLSKGDGSHCHIGNDIIYASSQYGDIEKFSKNLNYIGNAKINLKNLYMIQPFAVSKKNDNICFLPTQKGFYSHFQFSELTKDTLQDDWVRAPFSDTLAFSTVAFASDSIAYTSTYNECQKPILYRITYSDSSIVNAIKNDNSKTNMTKGSWVNEIAVNPKDENEILLLISNYNVESIFHSNDGGQSFTAVEGNLQGGPSVRDAVIMTIDGIKYYFIGTTTGMYRTATLNGGSTAWHPVATETMGASTVSRLAFDEAIDQKEDTLRLLIAATHGRGLFAGYLFIENPNPNPMLTSDSLQVSHIPICGEPTQGQITVQVNITGGTPPFQITGSYGDDAFDGTNFKFVIDDGTGYQLEIVDSNGAQMTIDESNLIPCTKLAVHLLDFSGEVQPTFNALSWTTAAEIDHDYFTLEHSIDGNTFTIIEQTSSEGTRTTATNYNYLHKNNTINTHYYRLSAIDTKGKVEKLKVITLNRGETKPDQTLVIGQVYPNPVQHQVHLTLEQVEAGTSISAQLYNLQGQLVHSYPAQTTNNKILTFDVADLPQGMYHLSLSTATGFRQSVKIVK